MNKETKLRIYKIRAKEALKFGSEVCVLKKREKTFRNSTDKNSETLGITKLDKEKNQCLRGKMGAQKIVKK
jgi:hypothetical protein